MVTVLYAVYIYIVLPMVDYFRENSVKGYTHYKISIGLSVAKHDFNNEPFHVT